MANEEMDALDLAEKGLLSVDELDDAPSRSTRRDRLKQKREATLAAFRASRDAILDNNDEYEDLYEEVDEKEYEARRRSMLQGSEFVVDDGEGDFGGYYDDGRDIMEDEDEMFEAQYSSAARRAQRNTKGGAAGVRKKTTAPKKASRATSLFSSGKGARLGAAVVKMSHEAHAVGQDKLLAEVLSEANADDEMDNFAEILKARRAKKQKSLAHVALHGSVADAHDLFLHGDLDDEVDEKPSKPQRSTVKPVGHRKPPLKTEPNEVDAMNDADFGDADDDFLPEQMDVKNEEDSSSTDATNSKSPASAAVAKPSLGVVEMDLGEDDGDEDDEAEAKINVGTAIADVKEPTPPLQKQKAGANYILSSKPTVAESEPSWQMPSAPEQRSEIKLDLKVPPLDDFEGEQVLHFYWFDAYELPFDAKSDSIYLFGKVFVESVSDYVSCCIVVHGLERNLFVLPREYKLDARGQPTNEVVEMTDVYEEVDSILSKQGVSTRLAKPVKRNYAFEEKNVPAESDYLKIKYPASFGKLRPIPPGKTFGHVFGNNVSPLERFLMKRNLMGPCWLRIRNVKPASSSISYCKLEVTIDSPKFVTKVEDPPPAPPLTVLSLRLQTVLNRKTQQNEILAIVGLVCKNVQLDGKTENIEQHLSHFSLIRKLQENPFPFDFESTLIKKKPGTKTFPSELIMLNNFLARLLLVDPDVIVGHNIFGMDLDVIMHRMKQLGVSHWSRIGRLRRTKMPHLQAGLGNRKNFAASRDTVSGRLLCDVQQTARELIRQVSYDLTELVQHQLHMNRAEIEPENIPKCYSQTTDLLRLIDHVERDAFFSLQLMFKLEILPLMKQITNITGGLMSRTLTRGRSDRNEFLLCHEFHRRKYIVPDQPERNQQHANADEDDESKKKDKTGRRKPQYAGGLVLEPKRGFYDNYILLLDFNSLYPSIIQEYNLCFTTVKRHHLTDDGGEQFAELPDDRLEKGVLPRILKNLIEKRRMVKQLIKQETDATKLAEYDIRQKALKLTANSMYGCLGFAGSRFYAKPIAELITTKGREILQNTVDLAQNKLNLDVIYGDTDSIMINTRSRDFKETKMIGQRVKKEVNALYKELEIDIDGVYKTMLLLKKKKYAALAIIENKDGSFRTERETKGLDIVRRDWCGLAHRIGNIILNKILTQEQGQVDKLVEECHEELHKVGEDARGGNIPLEEYIIHKSLTKDPEQYPDAKNQPHVQVALRLKALGKSIKQHDTIPYIICDDGSDKPATQRAYHPDDVRKSDTLKVDIDYYLKSQVHPVVSRMLEPIEGTDNAQIAECLGLDAASFRRQYETTDLEEDLSLALASQLSDEERFRTADPLRVTCRKCNHSANYPGVFRVTERGEVQTGLLCPNPGCTATYPASYLKNRITLEARRAIHQHYSSQLICSEVECPRHTRGTHQLSVNGPGCLEANCQGIMRKQYTEKQLYTQLSYFVHLFDVEHAVKQLPEDVQRIAQQAADQLRPHYGQVYAHAEQLLNKSARRFVHLGQLFGGIKLTIN
eukprot:m.124092 g.124092  ORF g.124092 m.124092 type:complete len:1520 (+) comp15585_c0_seq2:94-4653(+)